MKYFLLLGLAFNFLFSAQAQYTQASAWIRDNYVKKEFYILNRYISNVKTNKTEIQQHYVLTVNEYFNKNFFNLGSLSIF